MEKREFDVTTIKVFIFDLRQDKCNVRHYAV